MPSAINFIKFILKLELNNKIVYVCNFITDYRVVVICSLADEERAHVVSKLHQYRRENAPLPHTTEIASYLKMHFVTENRDSAAMVDPEMYDQLIARRFVHLIYLCIVHLNVQVYSKSSGIKIIRNGEEFICRQASSKVEESMSDQESTRYYTNSWTSG